MPTEMELTLEQTQQGVSYEVSVSIEGVEECKRNVKIKGEKNEALYTLRQKHGQYIYCQKHLEHAEYDESNTYVLERFNTTAGNPVKKILLQLNLSDHRSIPTDSKRWSIKVKEVQRSFRHSDTERLSRSDEVLKLKNFKKDATLKLSKSTNQERCAKHPTNLPSNVKSQWSTRNHSLDGDGQSR
ncbi:hypothetical protein Tco_0620207 [Tanacetum coccineum]